MRKPDAPIFAVLSVLLLACGASSEDAPTGGAGGNGGAGGGASGGCSEADLDACEYRGHETSYTVREGIHVTEPVTGRDLSILVRVPDGPGPFPTVVWSHGGGFNDNGQLQAVEWGDALASHGYAVVHVAHASLDAAAGMAICAAASVPAAECLPPTGDEDANGLIALVKTHDVVAVLDALPMLSDASVAAGGPAVDLERVAVAGWSAGSRAPIVTFGGVFYPSPSAPLFSMPHTLPKAALALSPIAPGYAGFFDDGTQNTWQGMRGPVLVCTGDNDLKPSKPDLTGEGRRVAFDDQPADGARWLLYSKLPGGVGEHATYNLEDLGSSDERLSRLSRALRSVALAFFDARLSGDAAAAAWLDSTDARVLAGDAEWVHK